MQAELVQVHTRITWTAKQVQEWMMLHGRECSLRRAREILDMGLFTAMRLKAQRYADMVFADTMTALEG